MLYTCCIQRFQFEELLQKDKSVSIHCRNIQTSAIEMYIATSSMSLEIGNEMSQTKGEYYHNLHYTSEFIIPPIHSVCRGSYSALNLRPKICELISSVI